MEYIILILFLFIIINTILKQSYWKWWQSAILGLVCGIFIQLVYPYAINQSKSELGDYLNNTKIMQDMAVLVTLESVLYLGFCFAGLRRLYGTKPRFWMKLLDWYPGLLIFPVLFYLLTNLIFSLPGVDFRLIAYSFAGAVVVLFPLLSRGIKYFLPEKELRLEVQFLVSLFVGIIGLICTVNGNVTYEAVKEPLNVKALLVATGVFLFFFLIGYLWNKYKWRFKKN